jgi:hypothetical protein
MCRWRPARGGGGHSLLQLCTMCVLIKNNRPRTAVSMYWIPTPSPIADRYKIYPPLLQSKVPFCRHTKMFKDRTEQLLAYWILERWTRSGYRGWAARTLEPLYQNKYWGPIAGHPGPHAYWPSHRDSCERTEVLAMSQPLDVKMIAGACLTHANFRRPLDKFALLLRSAKWS